MQSKLFEPIQLRGLELPNRIIVSPMCQYQADGGSMTDWHIMHVGSYAISGAGLFFVEATGVEAAGRISPACTGLYNDENEVAMRRVLGFCRQHGETKIGIQLAHAGRKASSHLPWEGRGPLSSDEGAWETFAPSAVPVGDNWPTPTALDSVGMERVKQAFVKATERAARIGFDAIEVHSAHGYLLHSFLSPLSNQRDDAYGGNLENRMRFPLEVFEAMRAAWPDDKPMGYRVSGTDWIDGGWAIDDTVALAKALQQRGCDFMDISAGGVAPVPNLADDVGPGYQADMAAEVKRQTGILTMAVGMIAEPKQAEHIIRTGQADMVALARAMMFNPRWPWHAAVALEANVAIPPTYDRDFSAFGGRPMSGTTVDKTMR